MKKILILGGGFGGLYTALELEKTLAKDKNVEVTLVNRENYFLYTPMLHEVAASDLDLSNIVSPAHKLLRRVRFMAAEVDGIDLDEKRVTVRHGFDSHPHALEFDYLVVGLGSVTSFHGIPGLAERALTMKTLGDAVHLRNRLIAHLEEANSECCSLERRPLLTFVVAGGGFAGVETIAGINDFLREAIRFYPNLETSQLRLVLVHSGEVILPELGEKLGRYAQEKLAGRGIEIRTGMRVKGMNEAGVVLSDGSMVQARTILWTAGTSPSPIIATLPCAKEGGRLVVNDYFEVPGWPGVYALGDSALVPDAATGKGCPPTAQHALRQGKVLARNLEAAVRGTGQKKPFRFRTIGQLAAIGNRTGVAKIFGVSFSGFLAWWLWRTIYLAKLPRAEKKLRVMLDWTLDLFFSKDLVQFETIRSRGVVMTEMSDKFPAAARPHLPPELVEMK
jgi:NADH:ubiquinone reductase (H+-translocating)